MTTNPPPSPQNLNGGEAMREFPTLDVVTVYTGLLVSDYGIGSVYELCGYMLDDVLMTHQLPAASRACQPSLAEQFPWLPALTPPEEGDIPALKAWCAGITAEHGDTLNVAAVADPAWKAGNALQDLADIMGDRQIIGVVIDDGNPDV